jgi:hypothetical protein
MKDILKKFVRKLKYYLFGNHMSIIPNAINVAYMSVFLMKNNFFKTYIYSDSIQKRMKNFRKNGFKIFERSMTKESERDCQYR